MPLDQIQLLDKPILISNHGLKLVSKHEYGRRNPIYLVNCKLTF